MANSVDEVSTAIAETMPVLESYSDDYLAFREVGKLMLRAWDEGRRDIIPTVTSKMRS